VRPTRSNYIPCNYRVFRLNLYAFFLCFSFMSVTPPLLLSQTPGSANFQPTKTITRIDVVVDDNYPPYILRSSVGKLEGYLVDYWALWEKKTGVQVNLIGMDWARALKVMKDGQVDVIDTVFRTPDRERLYYFTPHYADIPVPVYVRKSLGPLGTFEHLKGLVVAVKEGDACISTLQEKGVRNLEQYRNYGACPIVGGKKTSGCKNGGSAPGLEEAPPSRLSEPYRFTLSLR
jgi:hypothetical protein